MKKGWKKKPFAELCDYRVGKTPARKNKTYWTNGEIPWISISDMVQGENLVSTKESISMHAFEKCFTGKIVPSGTLLMSFKLTIGRTCFTEIDAVHNEAIISITPRQEINRYYLRFFLPNIDFGTYQDRQVKGQTLNKSKIDRLVIDYPPLPEQKKIAAILLKLQQAIKLQAKIIRSLRDLKNSTMQHLFTHGVHGKETKVTKIGEMPVSWEESTLGELCMCNNGCIQTGPFGSQLHVSDYLSLGVPVVNPTHMFDNRIIHERIPCVSNANANRLSRHLLETGDILFARRGVIGRHALITKCESGWLCGTGCFLIRIRDSRVSAAFISWLLYSKSSQDWLMAHASGAIMPNLNNKILQTCPVAFPKNRTEQSEIIRCLDGLEKKLNFHKSKKSSLQDIFKVTLNKLMTGDISTKDLHIDTEEVSI